MRRTATILTLALGSALALSGCTRMKNTQGYIADDLMVRSILPGVDNRESVSRTLGNPTIASQWGDKQWYYVQRKTAQLAYLNPKPTEQLLLVVSFDDKGNVASVERRGLEHVAAIKPEGDTTPTLGRETGILKDLFGNIGSVGAAGGGGGGPN